MKLIDKDALVAEIERLRKIQPTDEFQPKEQNKIDWLAGKEFAIITLQMFLDTLEVKEVDLDFTKEVDMWVRDNGDTNGFFNVQELAKYFFELGLKVQHDNWKVEPVRKVWHYANEHPEIEKPILLRKVNGVVELAICHDENFYPEIGEMWAYIEDLLNLSNVERTVKNLKEPVSEDLLKELKGIVNIRECVAQGVPVIKIARHFANWQKAKDESTTEDLEEYINELSKQFPEVSFAKLSRIAVRVSKWQKEKLWKPADGDNLPEIDREVIAILDYDFGHYKVVYAHRPNPNGWNGTNIDTGEKEHFEPVIYDNGGWNQPHVLYWLDTRLPYEKK